MQTAVVLFKDADETAQLLQVEYDPQAAMIEYFEGSLIGLKESVDNRNDEIITVNGIQYGVHKVRAKYDGKTFFADLELIR